ncbi:hypothetical protein T492DRAFT_1110082 [Pavlovales sp. CCMP2436]|nr:hypothetical protein T492DRAFT_1110082 [Pavlovales sp. CCMP2436]
MLKFTFVPPLPPTIPSPCGTTSRCCVRACVCHGLSASLCVWMFFVCVDVLCVCGCVCVIVLHPLFSLGMPPPISLACTLCIVYLFDNMMSNLRSTSVC